MSIMDVIKKTKDSFKLKQEQIREKNRMHQDLETQ
jgi:hypothetical protein